MINKLVFNISDQDDFERLYGKADKREIDKELIEVDDFKFYLEHLESAFESWLELDFIQFYKNIAHNASLKKFIKGFLESVQKHEDIISQIKQFNNANQDQEDIDVNRYKNIIKLVLKLVWNAVSNKSVCILG